MKAAVLVFPGSNREGDVAQAIELVTGRKPAMVWHGDGDFEKTDLIVIPGGFSYGDYLRCGAMAAQSPVMAEVKKRAAQGVPVLAICNGFQIAAEAGLLPGVLMRNAHLKFVCSDVHLKVETSQSLFTNRYQAGQVIKVPVAHAEGNYFTDADTLKRLEDHLRAQDNYLYDTLSKYDKDPIKHQIAWHTTNLSVLEHLFLLPQHEAVHQGQWSLAARQAGIDLPKTWVDNWKL